MLFQKQEQVFNLMSFPLKASWMKSWQLNQSMKHLNGMSWHSDVLKLIIHGLFGAKDISMSSAKRRILSIAIPVGIQSAFQLGLTNIDAFMLSSLGEKHLAAASLANEIHLFVILITTAFAMTGGFFIAQFSARSDEKKLSEWNFATIAIGLAFAVVASILCFLFKDVIIYKLSADPEVQKLLAEYFLPIIFSTIPASISIGYGTILKNCSNVMIPLRNAGAAILINSLLNYLLIFGKFGFPELGILGAAVGTVIAKFTELTIYILFTKIRFRYSKKMILEVFLRSQPVLLNYSLSGIALIVIVYIYSHMGTEFLVANRFVNATAGISVTLLMGFQVAASTLIGSELGLGNYALAINLSKKILTFSAFIGLVLAILSSLCCYSYLKFVHFPENTQSLVIQALIIHGLIYVVKVMNMVILNGILPSGGKTNLPSWISIVSFWFVCIPLTYVASKYLPFGLVYCATMSGEISKFFFGMREYRKNGWAKRL
jgi:Na+-driven multidrug efflux pump